MRGATILAVGAGEQEENFFCRFYTKYKEYVLMMKIMNLNYDLVIRRNEDDDQD